MRKISASYLNALNPSAPFASIEIRNLDGSICIPNQPAQLDTAADWTIVPEALINQLGATPARFISLMGFGGVVTRNPVFEVELSFPTFTPVRLEVTSHGAEPWILLGRSVLNLYRIYLDGPSLKLTIEEP